MVAPRGIDLARSSVVNEKDPRDAILILLDGIQPPDEQAGPTMPRFADDAGADAALLALALPDRPVRVQWMRTQEHSWEPYASAMLAEARAALDADKRIVAYAA